MMGSALFWARFVLAALAVWRVSHLLASEDGPANAIAWVRARLGASILGHLMDCFGCLGLWVSIPFALLVSRKPMVDTVLTWLALSGAAFLLERATSEPLIIERSPQETKGDSDHGMLR
jgi:hypothetical protein